MTYEEVGQMTKADALRHPNWTMGPKITVDCATLMNKGLEVIEAMRLYRLPLDQVSVVIHRQSIVHSLVEYRDGRSCPAGHTGYAPAHSICHDIPPRTGGKSGGAAGPAGPARPLTFAQPDRMHFHVCSWQRRRRLRGGTACAVLNGANEEAVGLFPGGQDRLPRHSPPGGGGPGSCAGGAGTGAGGHSGGGPGGAAGGAGPGLKQSFLTGVFA